MTPAKQAKAAGLSSLAEVAQMTGKSVQTLGNWHRDERELFNLVILGCAVSKHKNQILNLLSN